MEMGGDWGSHCHILFPLSRLEEEILVCLFAFCKAITVACELLLS